MKSSKTFCLFSSIPPLCHFSPYSEPPRMLAMQYTPPCSMNITAVVLNDGVMFIWKPP